MATMARPGAQQRPRPDLVGSRVFWLAAFLTLVALVVCAYWRNGRLWIGFATMIMWSAFSAVNAIRCRRVHSLVTAPVYLAAAAAFALVALDAVEMQNWIVWVLAGGMLAASISERVLGKYLP